MKNRRSQEILIIAILTLTVTTVWVYLGIYSALKKSEKPILKPRQTQLLLPKLDNTVFEELAKRKIE